MGSPLLKCWMRNFLLVLGGAGLLAGCAGLEPEAEPARPVSAPWDYSSRLDDPLSKSLYHFARAQLLAAEGNDDAAIEASRKAIQADPDAVAPRLLLARLLLHGGQGEAGIRAAEDALIRDPDSRAARLLLGNFYFGSQQEAQALPHFRWLFQRNPEDENVAVHLAITHLRLGDIGAGIEVLKELLDQRPDSVAARLTLARLYRQSDLGALAEEAYRRLLLAHPRLGIGYLELADLLEEQGELDRALEVVDAALEARGGENALLHRKARLLIAQDRLEEAMAELRTILEQAPRDVDAAGKLGLLQMEMERWGEAARIFENLLEHQPDLDRIRYYLGITLERQEKWEEALAAFRAIAPESDEYVDAAIHIGFLLNRMGRTEEAIRLLRKRITDASESRLFLFLSSLYETRGELQAALATLEQGLAADPEAVELVYEKGIVLERLGKSDEAVTVMNRVLELEPGHPEALNYLAYNLAQRGQNLDLALEMARRALEQKEEGHIVDTLGWVYFRLGRLEDARRTLERAVDLQPGDAVIREHLGDVYRALGLTDMAREAYRKALEINGEGASIQRKLEEL